MKPIVIANNLFKKYSRNAQMHLGYGLSDLMDEIFGRKENIHLRKDEFYAVNDLTFDIQEGDTFALVGRNGSGKTTLLKMMNGIIKPDGGSIIMDGSVQALINLGAGFNPQLTGRENIFNSAALKGFSRKKTAAHLDEIIAFSELEEFIDSPIRTYSAGMHARLGFSVAIHLEPDILLIDEILSVGDFSFKNKCLLKLNQLKKQGVTIVLVSHSQTTIIQLCTKALWIHKGEMKQFGPARDVVDAYLQFLDEEEIREFSQMKEIQKDNAAKSKTKEDSRIIHGAIYDKNDRIDDLIFEFLVRGSESDSIRIHEELVLRYHFQLKVKVSDLNVSIVISRSDGLALTAISTLNGDLIKHIHDGYVTGEVHIPDLNLNPGNYAIILPIHDGRGYLYRNVVKEFVITGADNMTWELVDMKYTYTVNHVPNTDISNSISHKSSIIPFELTQKDSSNPAAPRKDGENQDAKSISEQPPFRIAIKEPIYSRNPCTTNIDHNRDLLLLGWFAGNPSMEFSIHFNEIKQNYKMKSRPDVERDFPYYSSIFGFHHLIPAFELNDTNELEFLVDGKRIRIITVNVS